MLTITGRLCLRHLQEKDARNKKQKNVPGHPAGGAACANGVGLRAPEEAT
jgi:hypothetical protein